MSREPNRGLDLEQQKSLLDTYLSTPSLAETASQALIRQFDPYILRLSHRLAKDKDSRAELYQEGVVALLEALRSYYALGPGVGLATHVLNYIKWRLLKHQRRELRQSLTFDQARAPLLASLDVPLPAGEENRGFNDSPKDRLAAVGRDPISKMETEMVEEVLYQAFGCLTPKQKTALKMIYFQGMKSSNLADHLKVSRPRATQLVKSALVRLRQELQMSLAA